jgi:hypothetical protein
MIKNVAEGTGLPESVVERIFEHVNDTGDLPHVLVARSNRGVAVPDNRVEYISFESSKTPKQIAVAIGAGETTCRGIREVLERGAGAWVIAGPNGFTVGGEKKGGCDGSRRHSRKVYPHQPTRSKSNNRCQVPAGVRTVQSRRTKYRKPNVLFCLGPGRRRGDRGRRRRLPRKT